MPEAGEILASEGLAATDQRAEKFVGARVIHRGHSEPVENVMSQIRVLSPVGVAANDTLSVPPLPGSLAGRTIGFIDNRKANFDLLADEIGAILSAELGVKTVIRRRKANAATPAAPEILAGLAKDCDVVFAGSAD